jgi:hypothetical protein
VRIDPEPRPKPPPNAWTPLALPASTPVPLPRRIRSSDQGFFEVLGSRHSRAGLAVSLDDLSSLLWHSTLLRSRRPSGRFDVPWESRAAPSAGGLHGISILVLPLEQDAFGGCYDPEGHFLHKYDGPGLALNRKSIADILGIATGTTLQLAADTSKYDACYEAAESLMWRDAGALATIICLVATALGINSTPIGRTGEDVVRSLGLPAPFTGAGAVHIGSRAAPTP